MNSVSQHEQKESRGQTTHACAGNSGNKQLGDGSNTDCQWDVLLGLVCGGTLTAEEGAHTGPHTAPRQAMTGAMVMGECRCMASLSPLAPLSSTGSASRHGIVSCAAFPHLNQRWKGHQLPRWGDLAACTKGAVGRGPYMGVAASEPPNSKHITPHQLDNAAKTGQHGVRG